MTAHRPHSPHRLHRPHAPHRYRRHGSGSRDEDALRAAQQSFRTLADISPEPALVHRDGTVVYANPAALRAMGVATSEGIVGGSLADLFHPEDAPTLAAHMPHMPPVARLGAPPAKPSYPQPPVLAGEPHETFGLRWRRRDQPGAYRITEAVAAPTDFEGAPGVLVVARDVTERTEFEHALLERDRMAALGTLSAGVAHEINNPLTYMLVNLEHVLRRLRAASDSSATLRLR